MFTACRNDSNVASKKHALFQLMPASQTGIHFNNVVHDSANFNIFNFRNFYNGGGVAIGDVNGDGLDDIYTCGAKGQSGALWLQKADGHFTIADSAVFAVDNACEDVDALFFDADGDKDMDLYVASGGNEAWGKVPVLLDRLYLNDGIGNFVKSIDALPPIYQNKATVCAADIDRDGDADLFIGASADALAYGTPQSSYILINNGKGKFTAEHKNSALLQQPGIVTAATFADINKDGWQDLIIAGEWMPVTLIINNHSSLNQKITIGASGLWQTIKIVDIDGDGNMDILAGNYGLNSKLHASKDAPLKLYVKDFDNNGTLDQLLTYSSNGKEHTFLGKEELERQLPYIRKNFLFYSSFAGKTTQDVFGEQLNNASVLQAQTLSSGIYKNDGKGNFSFEVLPDEMQAAPVFSFMPDDINDDGYTDVISGGNFYGVLPYEGRYDASWGDVLVNNKNKAYSWLSPVSSGWLIRGEVRDIKKLKTANGYLYIVARNNDSLLFMKRD